jgi:hypothetical protein
MPANSALRPWVRKNDHEASITLPAPISNAYT